MSTGLFGGSMGAGLGSRTPYIVASNTCGSTVINTWPSLTMESFDGFFGSSVATPRRFDGLDQYFSKIPSLIHFKRDRDKDSARTPLRGMLVLILRKTTEENLEPHLSCTVWYSAFGRSSGWAISILGSGLFALIDKGRRLRCVDFFGAGGSSGVGFWFSLAAVMLTTRVERVGGFSTGGIDNRRLAACSARAAARGGIFLLRCSILWSKSCSSAQDELGVV